MSDDGSNRVGKTYQWHVSQQIIADKFFLFFFAPSKYYRNLKIVMKKKKWYVFGINSNRHIYIQLKKRRQKPIDVYLPCNVILSRMRKKKHENRTREKLNLNLTMKIHHECSNSIHLAMFHSLFTIKLYRCSDAESKKAHLFMN